jgi:hypothetical protein
MNIIDTALKANLECARRDGGFLTGSRAFLLLQGP